MNIVYNASAGTGKTYQVVRLYEKLILEEGVDPRKILLMTFSENAASELRARISRKFLEARQKAEEEEQKKYERIEKKLLSAPIGTIHSFCIRLLKEHALEAGLSPAFSVIAEEDRDELLDQLCRDRLLKQLEIDPDLRAFCTERQIMGTGGFGSSVMETVSKLIDEAGSFGILLKHAEKLLRNPLPRLPIGKFESIFRLLKSLPKPSRKVTEAILVLEESLEKTTDPFELIRLFDQSFSGHFSYGEARHIYQQFKKLKEEMLARERYPEHFPQAQAFARYIQHAASEFQSLKQALDVVDFDDQLRMAKKLLTSGKVSPNFQYIIVDEAQDTSRIQCSLIQSLWNKGNYLVICGDRKQSIYAWRGADPKVMPDLENEIMEREHSEEKILKTSYRSKRPILDVANALFPSVYEDGDYKNERDHLNPKYETLGEKTCVEFLTLGPDEAEKRSKKERTAAEMEAVANRIHLLTKGTNEWKPKFRYVDEDGDFQPISGKNNYRYADVLILFRRTTNQPVLERALRQADIPYTLCGKASDLFSRQETFDVSLFLNVITNPKDALSLVGFLRSPWIGLSDEAIAQMAWNTEHSAMKNLIKTDTQAGELIERYRGFSSTKSASELVSMLIEETGYDAVLSGLSCGAQRLANLRKILDWLRETEKGVQTTLGAAARKLAERIANPPKITEAPLFDPERNAVTIMTVHGAKGLTKRVIFIPEIDFTNVGDKGFARIFMDEADRDRAVLGIRMASSDNAPVLSPGFAQANERAKTVKQCESNNLLYVAMTRARDLIVMSASSGKHTGGWHKKIKPMIGKQIRSVCYDDLAGAAGKSKRVSEEVERPSSSQLTAALQTLPPPPASPRLQRISATYLAAKSEERESFEQFKHGSLKSIESAAALGSLGHAVLEQLAFNRWSGCVAGWLEQFRDEFGITEHDALSLKNRLERTRKMMLEQTAGVLEIHPEFPFVLHEHHILIDGIIDLLCRTKKGYAVYDYKFTETSNMTFTEHYQAQMAIYKKAAGKMYPDARERKTNLVVVSEHCSKLESINV